MENEREQDPDNASPDEQRAPKPGELVFVAQQTYDVICDALQLPITKRPRLQVLTKDKAEKMQVYGQYIAKHHLIRLSPSAVDSHYTIAHELAHGVSRKEMGYLGSHGIPYIVLHDLIVVYYFDNQELGNGAVVDAQWSKLGASAKAAAKAEAAEIVKQIQASIGPVESLAQKPSILELADHVARSAAGKYCFNWKTNFKALFRFVDKAWTQQRGVYEVIGKSLAWFIVADVLVMVAAGALYNTFKIALLQIIAGSLLYTAMGALMLFSVYSWGVKKFAGYDPKDTDLDVK